MLRSPPSEEVTFYRDLGQEELLPLGAAYYKHQ